MPQKKITKKQESMVRKLYVSGRMGPEISDKLNLSLKQVYGSLRRQNVPRKTLKEQNRILFEKKKPSFKFKNTLSLKERELLIAAIMLYYGEGAKTGVTVDLANSDERIIKLFLKFLRRVCRIDEQKLRFYLYCFSDQNVNHLLNFWSSRLKVKNEQFTKPYIRSVVNKGRRTMPHGVLHVRYSDKKLLEKILFLCKELINSL